MTRKPQNSNATTADEHQRKQPIDEESPAAIPLGYAPDGESESPRDGIKGEGER